MNQLEHIFSTIIRQPANGKQVQSWKRSCWDVLLALTGTMAITLLIDSFSLKRVPNISLIYLLAVLILGSRRGLLPRFYRRW